LSPGESADVEVRLLYDIDYSSLEPGVTFTIMEGGTREVGDGVVL
jgi:translation elongation factor EF-Tu-like GTPase